ncbi:nuclear transcription factor Y subunit beta isoform X2 [Apodemus sylvaticus]|uniref:nuclear transcription factor Y subunit beta isoform X2 n=1 Tax=Apodemus sylvaticus TaxID=10129 RepID=UPI00224384DB|nr:nuclear transcription factor Y subunit beta isoform X2 [Apodemus sylvaticus]
MSVSSRRRPRRQRRGGRGHSQSAAFGRAGPPGEAAVLRAQPSRAGRGAAGALCAGPRARPGPGWAGQLRGSRGGSPGPAPFCPGSRRAGNAAPRSGRFVSRIPAAAGVGRGRRGDALRGAAGAPASRGGRSPRGTSGLAGPWPAPRRTACSHLAAGSPRTCPEAYFKDSIDAKL